MMQTRILMGMPITIEIYDPHVKSLVFDQLYNYFHYVDDTFSPFKDTSFVGQVNHKVHNTKYELRGDIAEVLNLCEKTKQETDGYFDAWFQGIFNPSGVVKGWAIYQAAQQLHQQGFQNFYIDAGGDIQVSGRNCDGEVWRVGIQNPWDLKNIIKRVKIDASHGIATSGTYIRGNHIYNPKSPHHQTQNTDHSIVSLTVIGPNVLEADRFATAAFAMGRQGIPFIESLPNLEGYLIDNHGIATYTSGWENYVI